MKDEIVIIQYGVGNLKSVENAFTRLDIKTRITHDKNEIKKASGIIIPGVGAFDYGMANLIQYDLVDVLNEQVLNEKIPVLGVCLGMQLFAESSTEGRGSRGLGWIPGHVIKIKAHDQAIRIPHVGWNDLVIAEESALLGNFSYSPRMYFDHSYMFTTQQEYISSQSQYGVNITASVEKENIFGCQFHPEISDKDGLKVLRAFSNIVSNQANAL